MEYEGMMSLELEKEFTEALSQAWKDHTRKTEQVRVWLDGWLGARLDSEQILEIAALATHVYGEHFGRWDDGLDYLAKLKWDNSTRFRRQVAILKKARDLEYELTDLSDQDRFYVLTLAVPAVTLRKNAAEGQRIFREAEKELENLKSDPAARRLFAVMTANLTCDLLERADLSVDEKRILVMLAEASFALWAKDGSEADLAKARYRLGQVYPRLVQPENYGSGRYPRYLWVKP